VNYADGVGSPLVEIEADAGRQLHQRFRLGNDGLYSSARRMLMSVFDHWRSVQSGNTDTGYRSPYSDTIAC
jgi:hypothetical protein